MSKDYKIKLSMISEELFSTDWAGRFDSFETFQGASRVSVDKILDQIEVLVKSNLKSKNPPKNNQELMQLLEQSEQHSSEWLWGSVLLKVSSIRMSMQKNLGHSAVLASIHLMSSLFGVLAEEETTEDGVEEAPAKPKAQVKQLTPKPARPQQTSAGIDDPNALVNNRRPQAVNSARQAANAAASTNVVLNQLVPDEEPSSTEGVSLSQQCHEVAEQLTEKYPEYTLTAIRVLTAEKLGVSRQYLENLGVTPKKFRS